MWCRPKAECFAGLAAAAVLLWTGGTPAEAASPPAPASSAHARGGHPLGAPLDADNFRPTGPVTITADRAELESGHAVLYTGHVTLVSNTVKMQGDRLELHQLPGRGAYQARITGTPAHMNHAGNGPDNPPVSAQANTLVYDSRSTEIELLGDALFTRGDNQITADTIHYNLVDRKAQAEGGGKGQVNMTFTPPPPGSSSALEAP